MEDISLTIQAPASMADFQRMFSSEAACEKAFFAARWPNGFVCPRCGSRKFHPRRTRRTFVCRRCRKQVNLTAGTLLDRTHLPLSRWLLGIYLMISTAGGLSAKRFGAAVGVHRIESVLFMQGRIRIAMAHADRDALEGVVVIDETPVSDRDASRRVRGWIAGAFEVRGSREGAPESGRIRLAYLPTASERAIHEFVFSSVAPGAVVVSDDSPRHARLDNGDYVHVPYLSRATSTMANFRQVARWELAAVKLELEHTHRGRVDASHLQGYLDEIAFRHNYRSRPRGAGFQAVLSAIANASPHIGRTMNSFWWRKQDIYSSL